MLRGYFEFGRISSCLNSMNAEVFFIKGYIVISCTPVNIIVYLVYFFYLVQ